MLGCGGADGFPPLDLVGIYGGARAYVNPYKCLYKYATGGLHT